MRTVFQTKILGSALSKMNQVASKSILLLIFVLIGIIGDSSEAGIGPPDYSLGGRDPGGSLGPEDPVWGGRGDKAITKIKCTKGPNQNTLFNAPDFQVACKKTPPRTSAEFTSFSTGDCENGQIKCPSGFFVNMGFFSVRCLGHFDPKAAPTFLTCN